MKTMCVTGRSTSSDTAFGHLLAGFATYSPDYLEVRDKSATDRRVLDLLRRAVAELPGSRVLANARFDVALAAGAAGVVLPEAGLPVAPVRRETPRGFVVGKSTHSISSARSAAAEGADLVLIGPVFSTPSKPDAPLTPAIIDELASAWPAACELFLIGGIDRGRLHDLRPRADGFTGVAAIRLFEEAADPGDVVAEARER
jgi:thiamine-phosphate pyrophosphorylase